ncbi:hypothetical protein RJ639_024470, partial [Escallonia herrerae]
MDSRRTSRVIDPKIRKVGFFTVGPAPDRTQSGPAAASSPPASNNSLSPVMIPPPRHASDNLSRAVAAQLGRRFLPPAADHVTVGSYNPPDSILGSSPVSTRIGDGEFSEDSANWIRRTGSGKLGSSLPSGGFDLSAAKADLMARKGLGVSRDEKDGEVQLQSSSKSVKEKPTKAERRALQEAQRAAKAAAKGSNADGTKPVAVSGEATSLHEQMGKTVKHPTPKKEGPLATSSEKKGGDRLTEKDRKKDVPPPRMQFDDKSRVEKAKRRAVVKQTEARNRVELFRHLPQYERGNQLPDLESKFFQLDPMHPAVYKVGLRYIAGDIVGGNARCISMLQAFQEAIKDCTTPPEKAFARDLTAKINAFVSFLIECRPLSISMGNAIRFLKARIAKLSLSLSESEAKASLGSDIDRFINEKIILADKVIVGHAVTKIREGDVLLTYGSSALVEMILLHAHENGKKFRVVVVDSRPKLEGQALLRRLVGKGLTCTYTHINAVSYIMHEVTRVLLGAASVLSNGTVYSRVGTACVAMVAHAFHVPVLVIQMPYLSYDVTPSDYVSMIITDYGMVTPAAGNRSPLR